MYFDDTEATEFLTHSELQELIEYPKTDDRIKTCADFLLNALNDYPKFNLQEPKELISELKTEIGNNLNYDNLLKFSNSNVDSWKIEATSSLLEMFDFDRTCNFDKEIKLETIILNLTKYYKQKIKDE